MATADAKTIALQQRVDEFVVPGINQIQTGNSHSAQGVNTDTCSDGFGGGVWSATQQDHLLAWRDLYNDLVDHVAALEARHNDLLTTLDEAGVITKT